jgi:hypothetical protein
MLAFAVQHFFSSVSSNNSQQQQLQQSITTGTGNAATIGTTTGPQA